MLTPQDISEKRFVKAVFGGYDMPSVDEFLETVAADYSTLYKDIAILKGKLKVLVEKVEEYRSTEDAMRMALLTAQRMGEEITIEAAKTKEEMLKTADEEVKTRLAEINKKIAQEEVRLAAASKETAKFLELSHAIVRKHSEFLNKLEAANKPVKQSAKRESTPAAAPAEQMPPVMPAPAPAPVAPAPAPAPAPAVGFEFDNIASEIGSAVEQMTAAQEEPQQPAAVSEADVLPMLKEEGSDTIELPATEGKTPDITPRPKFDFDDLKFGANFDNDD